MSLITRFFVRIALEEQVWICITLRIFDIPLLTPLESLTGDVFRPAKAVLIRHQGDDKKVFM